jgi:hypothetical protein
MLKNDLWLKKWGYCWLCSKIEQNIKQAILDS